MKRSILQPILFVFISVFSLTAMAQEAGNGTPVQQEPPVKENFEKKQLESFIEANVKVVQVEHASQQRLVQEVEKSGLSVERFNELANAQTTTDSPVKMDSTEQKSFDQAVQKLNLVQQEIEKEMVAKIKETGLDLDTYQEIAYAYQKSEKVKGEVDALLPEQGLPPNNTETGRQQGSENETDTSGGKP